MSRVPAGVRIASCRVLARCGRAVALLSLAVLATACQTSATSSSPSAGQQHLTIALVPGVDTAPLAIAVKDGLFREHGITVRVKRVSSSSAAYNALRNGTADVAAGDYSAFFYAISTDHARLRLITDGYDAAAGTMQVLTLPGSGITSPADLVGKAVATPYSQVAPYQSNFPYNIQTLATQVVLQSDGVSPADVTWQQMPASQMISALKNHLVSAILVTEPWIVQAETQLGALDILDSCSGVTANLPLTGYFSTAAFAERHDSALRDFRAALITAQANAGSRSTVQSVLLSEHMSAQDAALVNIGQYPTFLNVGQVQRVADLMYDSGMITSPVSLRSLLLN